MVSVPEEKSVTFFLPLFLFASSSNADVMVGAAVAVLDHEVKAVCC